MFWIDKLVIDVSWGFSFIVFYLVVLFMLLY